ncbi:pantetheine-phosphate adenylyltransferase [Candidatus Liberibacter sp.]|uniref:pantetheine-phosphate adenylyltransferase n=1 Tax=Candidatus Liberibacter sp. TaxID=34022 RepID=UPI0015F36B6C|nr:pantetheine-phosphate adenylyltransferase [Candidatus Liberibacter sp.]MBA5724047.1 pantetheine-phosphate adenylyltransferase [Candidatus Liberibacter sp.]
MIRKAIYTGSFNPVTNGHMDILIQALSFVEEVVCAIGSHPSKKETFLSFQERLELIMQAVAHLIPESLSRVSVVSFGGLAVDLAKDISAQVIIRGLRDVTDFDYEMRIASVNHRLFSGVTTVPLFSRENSRHITSTLVRHLVSIEGDITSFTPEPVSLFLTDRYK